MAGVNSKSVDPMLQHKAACFGGVSSIFSLLGLTGGSAEPEPVQDRPKIASFGPSAKELEGVKDTLTGEAQCFGCGGLVDGRCFLRLRCDAVLMELLAGKAQEDSVEVTGANVECEGTTVSLSRNSLPFFRMTFESEKVAGLWATKLAVAGGNTDCIAKLFSMQRHKIQELERHTEEAQGSNEEIERCLNFLSKEYVDMRHQVRKVKGSPKINSVAALGGPQEVKETDLLEPSLPEFKTSTRHQSEPEKEPPETMRPQEQGQEMFPELGKRGSDKEPCVPSKAAVWETKVSGGLNTRPRNTAAFAASSKPRTSMKTPTSVAGKVPEGSPAAGRSPAAEPSGARRSNRQVIANHGVLTRTQNLSSQARKPGTTQHP
eukprot:TRINITY_DN594_c0_g1_i2.p1 TRINITY_DN594_c0_g1~~TRINITY_DN594_c0_g1_i2.p1  ORF type:complete len:397 (-),score=76.11 TRINITY_DN594_c0_g1_i2:407-1531(-)